MLQIPLSGILPRFRHLYYQDGPVMREHLTKRVASIAKKDTVRVIGIASPPPPPPTFGDELNAALSKGSPA